MKNPWEEIRLSDYEAHMKQDSVQQLQTLNSMMKDQLNRYAVKTVMILGIAGGNGLEHIDAEKTAKVYGVDINPDYLKECAARYPRLQQILTCLCIDLHTEYGLLPHAGLLVANLLIEYIGYECFQKTVFQVKPAYVSCVIQENGGDGFVSDSPYVHAFDRLDRVHHTIQEEELTAAMKNSGYCPAGKTGRPLPNGRKLVQLDFKRQAL